MNKIIFVILFLLLGSKLLIADDKSPPKVTTQQYDNWTYQCVESGKDKNCEVSQTIRIQNTNINFSIAYTKFLNDKIETDAIKIVFKEHAYNVAISSTKSMTGHLLGAAGVIESIAAIMAIKEGVVPPTFNQFTEDPQIDNKLNLTLNKAKTRNVNVAISNTFGFGGHNASIIFKKHKK